MPSLAESTLDVDAMEAFYRDVVGFAAEARRPVPGGTHPDGSWVELVERA